MYFELENDDIESSLRSLYIAYFHSKVLYVTNSNLHNKGPFKQDWTTVTSSNIAVWTSVHKFMLHWKHYLVTTTFIFFREGVTQKIRKPVFHFFLFTHVLFLSSSRFWPIGSDNLPCSSRNGSVSVLLSTLTWLLCRGGSAMEFRGSIFRQTL